MKYRVSKTIQFLKAGESVLITKAVAKYDEYQADFPVVEYLYLTWEELFKRRLRANTDQGREIEIAFPEGGQLEDGDLLAVAGNTAIIIKSLPERVISIKVPETTAILCWLCYELGNRHLPAWISAQEILVLYDPLLKVFLSEHHIAFTEESRVVSGREFLKAGGGTSHHRHPEKASEI
jgi:urease accessory protein